MLLALTFIEVEKARAETTVAKMDHADASLRYRQKQLTRLKELAAKNAVETHVVDEAEDFAESAKAELASAKSQVLSARAGVEEAKAKLEAAKSTEVEAQAALHGAQADLQKALIVANSTRVVCPFDGIVTRRGYHVGDFVRSGDATSAEASLLTVSETTNPKFPTIF